MDDDHDAWARLAVDAGVATVTLTAPSGPSRINADSARAWCGRVREAVADPSVRVIVVGAEGPVWSAGGDLAAFAQLGDDAHDLIREIGRWVNPLARLLHESDAISVAAVHGAAAGGGLGLMAACDLVVAGSSAVFTLGYAKLATNPDAGVSWFLPRQIGLRRTLELYLSSERLDAGAARGLGLVNRVVADDALAAEAARWAGEIAALDQHATAATKRLLRTGLDTPLEAQLEAEIATFADHTRHPDFAEGVRAFLERRPPRFSG
jgi:2-(1,2-epoxy-1,2-dihydrophenyl)acetyl-CoA isomerase